MFRLGTAEDAPPPPMPVLVREDLPNGGTIGLVPKTSAPRAPRVDTLAQTFTRYQPVIVIGGPILLGAILGYRNSQNKVAGVAVGATSAAGVIALLILGGMNRF